MLSNNMIYRAKRVLFLMSFAVGFDNAIKFWPVRFKQKMLAKTSGKFPGVGTEF